MSIDNAPAMMVQAETHLKVHLVSGRLRLITDDALSALNALPSESMDLVLSAYTLHNFLEGYRREVLKEILRVLKPKGWFVNGDRYGVDDPAEHLKTIQDEVRGYFRVFREINRPDLLEQWVVHLLSDESDEHRMRLTASIAVMQSLGFGLTTVSDRHEVNTLLISRKPCL
jgi:ubiquinone/menaquinone biosynthesis C-methylase UbiE